MARITKMAGFLLAGLATSLPVRADESACAVLQAAEVGETRTRFVCAQDALTESFLNSPAVVFAYLFGVLLVMFLVHRAAQPVKNSGQKEPDK
jgi:lysylphosphatidylglycerol synthetase-like protein (DUF2156 family)